jgi:tripartite-type tricarboxylate transporter receptor subunit TctC
LTRVRLSEAGAALAASLAIVAAALWPVGPAISQPASGAYPDKLVKVVMPFPPGGPTDLLARLMAKKLNEAWGQSVVVENRPGANGLIGEDFVAKSKPDGYTLMVTSTGFSINPSLYKMPYDPQKDLAPITQFVSTWQMLVVHPSVPVSSTAELIALAKSKPTVLNFGSYGIGSSAHLAAELMNVKAGVRMTHVPYPGFPQAITDLTEARVQLLLPTVGSIIPYVKSGKVRALAVTSPKRLPFVPDLPTISESGIPGYEAVAWVGMFAPAGTPQPIVSKVQQAIVLALASAEVKSYLDNRADVAVGSAPEEFAAFLKLESEKYAALVKAAGIKVN